MTTSTLLLELADQLLENEPNKAGPLAKLLYAFHVSRGDPSGELMRRTVIRAIYSRTEHCEQAEEKFLSETDNGAATPPDQSNTTSIAA